MESALIHVVFGWRLFLKLIGFIGGPEFPE